MAYAISDECISCGACAAGCPVNAISEGDGKFVIDPDTCTECGACAGKMDLAKKAKALNLDAIHDTVHEMAKDEARHGRGFEGLLKRYFNVEL